MNVIGAWVAGAKELVARDSAMGPVDGPCSLEVCDVIERRYFCRVVGEGVEHRVGAKTGHAGAPHVLETDWKGARCGEPLGLSEKQRRPVRIVRYDTNRTRFEAERVAQRAPWCCAPDRDQFRAASQPTQE